MAAAVTAPVQAATVGVNAYAASARPGSENARSTCKRRHPFVESWHQLVQPKLRRLLVLLGSQHIAKNLALAQVWNYLPVLLSDEQLLKVDPLCLLGSPELQGFHNKCCSYGVPVHMLGAMGKVWENGAVKVVQSLENLSRETHPCNRLQGGLNVHVEEVVYIPVFDPEALPSSGVVAVLEILISSQAHDYMVVANTISRVAGLMEEVQLSLSNPLSTSSPSTAAPAAACCACSPAHSQQDHATQSKQQDHDACSADVSGCAPGELHGPPTAPSSPTAAGGVEGPVTGGLSHRLPTPDSSPTMASPFAPHSPLASPHVPFPAPPQLPNHPAGTAGGIAGAAPMGRCSSVPPPPAPIRPAPPRCRTASLPSQPPPWPGAGWCRGEPPSLPAGHTKGGGGGCGGRGGMQRSMSRSGSVRGSLNELQAPE